MADHPLRPANHRRLGRPLPYRLANGTQAHPRTVAPNEATFLWYQSIIPDVSGISTPFGGLSRMRGQVTYALLTRAPLYLGSEEPVRVRLACVKHAASVRSEPGSNSPVYILN